MKWMDSATLAERKKIERLSGIIASARAEMRRIKARLVKRAQRKGK